MNKFTKLVSTKEKCRLGYRLRVNDEKITGNLVTSFKSYFCSLIIKIGVECLNNKNFDKTEMSVNTLQCIVYITMYTI